jgi:hypothetical protein
MNSTTLWHSLRLIFALFVMMVLVASGSACAVNYFAASSPQSGSKDGLVIRYLLVAPREMVTQRRAEVTCVVTDARNSELSYTWTASGGDIQPREYPDAIYWMSPRTTGNYTITVVVSNAEGASVTRSVAVKVTNDPVQHPFVFSMTCRNCNDGISASRFSEYAIRCDVLPQIQGEAHYTWFSSLGRIKGNGPEAIWTTGSQYGNALITVIVTDDEGNEFEGYLAININCCS